MVDIDFSGVDAFLAQLETAQKAFNNQLTEKYREWVKAIFYDIIELTPQWSGNLAANWFISTSSESGAEETIPEKEEYWPLRPGTEPHRRGDAEAVDISKARFDPSFGYSEQIFIFNPTEIAPQVEAQSIYIRGVNLLDGRVAMTAHAYNVYSTYNPLS